MAEVHQLEEMRKEMSKITFDIIRLCGERLLVAKKIGEIKATAKIPIENPRAEERIRNQTLEMCREYGINPNFCLDLLNLLLCESKRVQKEATKT